MPAQVLPTGSSVGVLPYAAKREPIDNRLAGLTRSPPMTRRALVARWTQVCHFHLLLVRSAPRNCTNRRALGRPLHATHCTYDFILTLLQRMCQHVYIQIFSVMHEHTPCRERRRQRPQRKEVPFVRDAAADVWYGSRSPSESGKGDLLLSP